MLGSDPTGTPLAHPPSPPKRCDDSAANGLGLFSSRSPIDSGLLPTATTNGTYNPTLPSTSTTPSDLSFLSPPRVLTNGLSRPILEDRPSPTHSSSLSSTMDFLTDAIKGRLLFAIPKKGRLYQKSLEMLEGADIKFTRSHRLDVALVQNHPIALVFLPASDIPRFVAHGNVDMGITGQDTILESNTSEAVMQILELGFGGCKLQVQVPETSNIQTLEQLAGKRVVSSYTNLSRRFFRKLDLRLGLIGEEEEEFVHGVKNESWKGTRIEYVGGSVEAACALGLADGIVDLVESGETMRAAGLHAIDTVMSTQAVLIRSSTPNKEPALNLLIQKISSRIAGFVASNKYVLCQYNIPRELLPDVIKITPGRRAPTISSIEDDGWVAVSAMVERKRVADVMDELVAAGAEDTFIVALQNCRVETRVGMDSSGYPPTSRSPPEEKSF
ncbi:HisG-domain-containing protein [Serendipita vermifera]|nr:HisG-domain-containing protein [Serendipita vermifera]